MINKPLVLRLVFFLYLRRSNGSQGLLLSMNYFGFDINKWHKAKQNNITDIASKIRSSEYKQCDSTFLLVGVVIICSKIRLHTCDKADILG